MSSSLSLEPIDLNLWIAPIPKHYLYRILVTPGDTLGGAVGGYNAGNLLLLLLQHSIIASDLLQAGLCRRAIGMPSRAGLRGSEV